MLHREHADWEGHLWFGGQRVSNAPFSMQRAQVTRFDAHLYHHITRRSHHQATCRYFKGYFSSSEVSSSSYAISLSWIWMTTHRFPSSLEGHFLLLQGGDWCVGRDIILSTMQGQGRFLFSFPHTISKVAILLHSAIPVPTVPLDLVSKIDVFDGDRGLHMRSMGYSDFSGATNSTPTRS